MTRWTKTLWSRFSQRCDEATEKNENKQRQDRWTHHTKAERRTEDDLRCSGSAKTWHNSSHVTGQRPFKHRRIMSFKSLIMTLTTGMKAKQWQAAASSRLRARPSPKPWSWAFQFRNLQKRSQRSWSKNNGYQWGSKQKPTMNPVTMTMNEQWVAEVNMNYSVGNVEEVIQWDWKTKKTYTIEYICLNDKVR